MKLRAVEIRNWACIVSLSLTDLSDGITVLHGPNRTGKSSLVQAIRSGLFDHFHDSQDSDLITAIPWKTKAVPHVAIEFEHAGQRYRITKTFAKTKEGQATLEQHGAGGWSTLVRGKDAAKRVREIVGVDSSEAGIFQMLWLQQRDFLLPTPREIDASLRASLEEVLESLITGRDIDFKGRLDKACERWFTVKTMKDRKDSPVTKLSTELEQALQRKAEIDQQWSAAESALAQYNEAIGQQPELQRSLQEAEADLARVRKECEGVRQRKAQFDSAVKIREHCESLFAKAERRLVDFDETARRLELETNTLAQMRNDLHAAEVKRAQVGESANEKRVHLRDAERDLDRHQQNRAVIEDRQRLLAIQQEVTAIEEKNAQAEALDGLRQELEGKLVGPPALTEDQIKELRRNREQAAGMRAKLEAEEIQVIIQAKQPFDARIATDAQGSENVSLSQAEERRWVIRQHAEFQIGDVASVRIRRGEEDRNLESLAHALADLDQTYRDDVMASQLHPNDVGALDQLTARRVQHERLRKDLESVRKDLAKTAPNGIPALHAQVQQARDNSQVIFARRPELRDWTPTQAEVDRLRTEFDEEETALQSRAHQAEEAWNRADAALRNETGSVQRILTLIAVQESQVKNLQEHLGRSERTSLFGDFEQARAKLAEAKQSVQDNTLTEAEQAIDAEFQNASVACAHRAMRLRDNEDLLLRLQTQLAGTEGLHQRRIQAEQTVNDLTRAHQREKLHAGAHKHLKDLFELVRQEQVRRTVGPINDRVMQWAKHLGIGDYSSLSFGDQLLPGGLVPAHLADGDAVELDRESFGTIEQLSLLIRLAVGGLLARQESAVAVLDDPLAHADPVKHRKMLEIFARAARGEPLGPHPAGPLQLIILTCHADRFDHLEGARQFDLAQLIQRGG